MAVSLTSLSDLVNSISKNAILQKLLDTANSLGLVTDSWQSGDPTLSVLNTVAARFADWEGTGSDPNNPISGGGVQAIFRGGFLGLATGAWLDKLATLNFNTNRIAATAATSTVILTNSTAATIGTINAGDITVQNGVSASKPTYRNTTGGFLGPNSSLTVTVQADIAGSSGGANIGDINTMVTNIAGVTCTNTTAAVGLDAELDANYTARAQQKFFSLSPNGPKQAASYYVLTPSLQSDGSGTTNVTRVRVWEEANFGKAGMFIAGPSGALGAGDVAKAQATASSLAEPLCVDVVVYNATNVTINVSYQLWVYDSIGLTTSQIQANVQAALTTAFATHQIGGDTLTGTIGNGYIFVGWIQAIILAAVNPYGFRCVVTSPAADVPLVYQFSANNAASQNEGDVAVLGSVTPSVTIITKPKP